MSNLTPEQKQILDAVLAAHMPRIQHLRREVSLLMIEQAGLFEIDRQLKEANKHIEDAEVPWDDLYFKFSELAARYHALGMTVATIIHEKQEQAMSLIDLIKSNLSEHGIDLDGESEDWPEILEEALKRE